MIAKKKECAGCGKLTYIWARKMCKQCASRGSKMKSYSPPRTSFQGQSIPVHTAVYMKYFGYDVGDTIISEISGLEAVDINHLDPRGMGGSKMKDVPENLMALTREEHDMFEDFPELKEWFVFVHLSFIATRKPFYLTHPNDETLKLIWKN